MNKQLPLLLVATVFLAQLAFSQPVAPPCPTPPPPGAENCQQACVYCDFDGYTGINNGTPSGGNTVCGAIALHNDQWFGFVACSEFIEITLIPSNCQMGNGLQAAFWDDCTDGDAIVCNPGFMGGGNTPLVLSYGGFTVGETYYYMLDGWSNDVCNFEILITQGCITPGPPGNASTPQGPTVVCPGAQVVYTIPDVSAAGYYTWTAPPGSTINGLNSPANIDAPEGTQVTITFGSQGGNVCVRAANACNPPTQQFCLPVVNQPIPITVKPPITICYEDTPYQWDEAPNPFLTNPGTFTLTSTPYDSYLGCDSTVRQTITVKNIAPTPLGTRYVCAGECFEIGNQSFCDPGFYNVTFESFQGCDSTVNFTLQVLSPVAIIQPPANPIDCNSSGVLLTSTGSTPLGQGTYSWQNANWMNLAGTANYNATLTGTYYLIVTVQGGGVQCRDTASVVVTGNTVPPGATATGGNINCLASSTTLMGNSPTAGVTYEWSGPGIIPANQFLQNPTVGVVGVYVLTVRNPANGCTSTASVTVNGDVTPPAANAVGGIINCLATSIVIDGSTNVPQATWNWSGPGITPANQTLEDPTVSVGGTYAVTVTNTVSGCTNTATVVVDVNNSPPATSAGPDQTLTCAVPDATLQGSGNAGGQPIEFSWAGPNGFVSTIAQPLVNEAGTYILTVLNTQNGCSSADTVQIAADQVLPTASAGADSTITCAEPSVTLVGAASSSGANFTATWSGPGINAGNANQYSPVVDQPGTYDLLIVNNVNGCTATDQVVVDINTAVPTADAGTDQLLTCTTPTGVTLSGSGTPANITYWWSGPGIGANNENQQNPQVTQAGTYNLVVTDPVNGCTATDQVIVDQDANVPVADAGDDLMLTCSVISVDIDGSSSSSGASIEYAWTGPGIAGSNATAQSPTGLTLPGTYTLTVTNTSNNCVNTDIVVIGIDTISPTASAGAAQVLNCFNGASVTLDGSASSSGASFTYLWDGPGINAGNQNLKSPTIGNAPGTYFLTVTNTTNSCTSTAQVNVTADLTAPTADAGNDQTIDCVVVSTTIGGSSSSGANFTYQWSGAGINASNEALATPNVSQPGTYTLVVTNSINGCTSSSSVVVNSNAVFPISSAGNDALLTCAAPTTQLDGSGSTSGVDIQISWTGPDITPANQTQLNPTVALPGLYILAVTNTTNSCVTLDSVIVNEDKVNPTASAGLDIVLNCQTPSTSINGSQSSTGANFSYLWTGAGINPSNENDQNPPIDQPGTYTLVVTDNNNGCTASDQVVVTQDNMLPTASAGADGLITCANQSQILDGSGSSSGALFTYVWEGPGINSNNFNLQSPTVSVSGTYTVTVTNVQNFCTSTDVVFVGINQTPPLTVPGPSPTLTCAATSATLDATQSASGPNISYAWSGPGIVAGQNTPTPTVNQPGLYTLVVTDANNGCSNSGSVNVGQNVALPNANAGIDLTITCASAATGVTLNSAGSSTGPSFSYLWSGPGITPANQTQPNPTVLVAGVYTLVITDSANGCSSSDSANVAADQNLPTPNAGADQTITCATPSVTLDGSGSSAPGGGTLTYAWVGPGILPGNANSPTPSVSVEGIYTLTVENPVTGCQASDQVVVNLNTTPPTTTATGNEITCQSPSVNVSATSSDPNSTYVWEGPGGQTGSTTPTISVDVAGLYVVTVTASNGCTATSSATVTLNADVPVGSVEGAVLNCLNNGTTTISGQVSSPAGSMASWSGPGIGTVNALSVQVSQPGNYTFTIVAPNGCVRPIVATVTADFVQPTIALAAPPEQIDCNTTTVTINAAGSSVGGNFNYQWTTQDGNIVSGANTLQPVVDEAGSYVLVISNNLNGCSNSLTVPVTIDPKVPTGFDVDVRNIRCFGDTNGAIIVNGIQGGTPPFFFSLNGGTASTGNQFTNLSANQYVLQLEDVNGCLLDTTISISEPGLLSVELGPDITIGLGEQVTVAAQIQSTVGIASVAWNYAPDCVDGPAGYCEGFTYTPLSSYLHNITVRDLNGCVARDEIRITVEKKRQIYVPNIFNPDSDLNFYLGIYTGIDVARINFFNVFDRWGEQVYQGLAHIPTPGADPDPAYRWDGKVRGQSAHSGVYVWYCEVEFIDGEKKLFTGDVTVIR
jgi:hypothetical protein